MSSLRGSPWAAEPVVVEVRTKTRNPTEPTFTCKQEHTMYVTVLMVVTELNAHVTFLFQSLSVELH